MKSIEMAIGHGWDFGPRQVTEIKNTFSELEKLVHEGSLRKLRLVYVESGVGHVGSFETWKEVLSTSDELGDWRGCEREVVWPRYRMISDRLREVLARCWGLEGGLQGWDDSVTAEDWRKPVKKLGE